MLRRRAVGQAGIAVGDSPPPNSVTWPEAPSAPEQNDTGKAAAVFPPTPLPPIFLRTPHNADAIVVLPQPVRVLEVGDSAGRKCSKGERSDKKSSQEPAGRMNDVATRAQSPSRLSGSPG